MTDVFTSTIEILSPPEIVFRYFVEPERLVRWMGDYARLEAVEGGTFSVDINGVLIRGHYVALEPARRIEIAWGEPGNAAMPPGSTHVLIELAPTQTGTRLTLTHMGLVQDEAIKHAMGWPHFLGRLLDAAEGRDPGKDPWAASAKADQN
jgi:uncharacterized protein YndB with AHSA1/START domain